MPNLSHPLQLKKIAIGDVVKLKSGGPAMTVQAIESADAAKCTWFWNGRVRRHTFSIHILILTDDTEESGLIQ